MGVCCSAPCPDISEHQARAQTTNLNGYASRATNDDKTARTNRLAARGVTVAYHITPESKLDEIHQSGVILRSASGPYGNGIILHSSIEVAKRHIPKDKLQYAIVAVWVVLGESKEIETTDATLGFNKLIAEGKDSVHHRVSGGHNWVVYNFDQILFGQAEVSPGHPFFRNPLFNAFIHHQLPAQANITDAGVTKVSFQELSEDQQKAFLAEVLRVPMVQRRTAPETVQSVVVPEAVVDMQRPYGVTFELYPPVSSPISPNLYPSLPM